MSATFTAQLTAELACTESTARQMQIRLDCAVLTEKERGAVTRVRDTKLEHAARLRDLLAWDQELETRS